MTSISATRPGTNGYEARYQALRFANYRQRQQIIESDEGSSSGKSRETSTKRQNGTSEESLFAAQTTSSNARAAYHAGTIYGVSGQLQTGHANAGKAFQTVGTTVDQMA